MKLIKIIIVLAVLVISSLANAETSMHSLTKGYADTLYCKIEDGCGSGSNQNHMTFDATNSKKRGVVWDITDSDFEGVEVVAKPDTIHIFGGEIE